MSEPIELTSEIGVTLIDSMGNDESIVHAARVSIVGTRAETEEGERKGLLSFLMKNKHACYDSETDVLTSEGWKTWPDIDGTETFITLNLNTNEIELQKPLAIIHEPYNGEMVKLSMAHVDALVTPNHRLVAAPRVYSGDIVFGLHNASEFTERSYRLRLGGGEWDGEIHAPELAELVGLIAADGHVGKTSISFSLVKQRTIDFLTERANVSISKHSNPNAKTYRILGACEDLKRWAKQTYTNDGNRCLPRELLELADQETLQALLDGDLEGDGSVSATGKITTGTVSRQLVNDLQELALKIGISATEIKPSFPAGGFQSKNPRPLFRLCFYRDRNSTPRIGWTTDARNQQVTRVAYDGIVHCATVPNGTLYVRRNGKPMWSGNSPFEHVQATFMVSAPVFVAREWHRHRTQSYNEMSSRYTILKPRFYAPDYDRPLRQVGKPGKYTFELGTDEDMLKTWSRKRFVYQTCWDAYQDMLENGIAKEVARDVLPLGIYTEFYATANLRNWLNFLCLRTSPDALYEIRQAAGKIEEQLFKIVPTTMNLWDENNRQSL